MGAQLEVRNAVRIGAHGAVLIGYLRSGTALIGQVTEPLLLGDASERRLEVIAVQRLNSAEPGGQAIGLEFRNPPRLADLRSALPAGAILVLEDALAAGAHGGS
jgi:hypothetical protein